MAPLVPLTPPPARPGGPPHVDTAGADVTATRARAGGPPTALIAVGIVVVLLIAAGILIIRLHLLHG
jgi:hypothetical protein